MNGYVLRLPEEESVVLSGPAARRLIQGGDGDAALLYIAVLKNQGSVDDERVRLQLGWDREKFRRALETLAGQGLVGLPGRSAGAAGPPDQPDPPQAVERQPADAYTRADLVNALEGGEFKGLTGAVEEKLGKKLNHQDLSILLGLYDYLGLPADVIFLLVGFCTERITDRYGPGRRPTLRQIEKEGYVWERLGLMDQESAAAYIRKYQKSREAMPRMMELLRLGTRAPSPSEEKFLRAWDEMGFEDEAIELAYDKTVVKCKELKWSYMNSILCSWHKKGLHTLAQIKVGDKPALRQTRSGQGRPESGEAVREDMARMRKFQQRLRREQEKEEP